MPLIYVPNMEDFFDYMKCNEWRYAIMRNFDEFTESYPEYGSKKDIDLIVENNAVLPILEKYKNISRYSGVKCDIHSVYSQKETDFRGHIYYPLVLSKNMLTRRVLWKNKYYVPCPEDWYYSLLYHITYHRAEGSGFDFSDPEFSKSSRYFNELRDASNISGLPMIYTLEKAHEQLLKKEYCIGNEILIPYIKEEYKRNHKSYFFGWLCSQQKGEMNLFVIRRIAVIHNKHITILKNLKQRYKILAIKKIPWRTRIKNMKYMRGGKWRRGGKPYIAVVVFDKQPVEATEEDKKIHQHVFNRNQFFKQELRKWFVSTTTAKHNANPLHSTDNEAEAIGHLSLFFNEEEQNNIFRKLGIERKKLSEKCCISL
jgi:hypothetical protein